MYCGKMRFVMRTTEECAPVMVNAFQTLPGWCHCLGPERFPESQKEPSVCPSSLSLQQPPFYFPPACESLRPALSSSFSLCLCLPVEGLSPLADVLRSWVSCIVLLSIPTSRVYFGVGLGPFRCDQGPHVSEEFDPEGHMPDRF